MNLIDHAIVIPTSPQQVWAFVGDIAKNSQWQKDYQEVSFLNSIRSAPGMRWRYNSRRGKEFVVEISRWYDGLGYEYHIVDGVPYQENRGQLRLQEIAEGTLVQWTFSYELSGFLVGFRHFGVKRQIENQIAESLRNLYRLVRANSEKVVELQGYQAKSLMQDAPDVESRLQYEPRYPSVLEENYHRKTDEFTTAKRKTDEHKITTSEVPVIKTNEIQADLPATKLDEDLFKPKITANQATTSEPSAPSKPELFPPIEEKRSTVADIKLTTVEDQEEISPPKAELEAASSLIEEEKSVQDKPTNSEITVKPVEKVMPDVAQYRTTATLPQILSRINVEENEAKITDTSQISVFHLFGMTKPSETQELEAVVLKNSPEKAISGGVNTPPGGTTALQGLVIERAKLRQQHRSKMVKIRRR